MRAGASGDHMLRQIPEPHAREAESCTTSVTFKLGDLLTCASERPSWWIPS